MSLSSASGFVGAIREYTYRGIQQLPIVLGTTAFLFMVSTGSIAYANLFFGLSIVIPIVTVILQAIVQGLMNGIWPNSIFWKTSGSQACNLIPLKDVSIGDFKIKSSTDGSPVPSYWIMGTSFFIGYAISNAVDTLNTPVAAGSNNINHEKRNTQAIFTIIATCIFSLIVLGVRLYYMRGCEGAAWGGLLISVLASGLASWIGYLMYRVSSMCGARSSDLLGILSQILPASSTAAQPIVCTSN